MTASAQDVFEVLSDSRRRVLIRLLGTTDGESVPIQYLVEHLASVEEGGKPVEQIDDIYFEDLQIYVRQNGLPQLAEYDLVEVDLETDTVEITGDLTPYLEVLDAAPPE